MDNNEALELERLLTELETDGDPEIKRQTADLRDVVNYLNKMEWRQD